MSKITSEDCAKWIVANVCPTTKLSDWKRISKRKVGGDIVRMFSNPNCSLKMVGVKESDVIGNVAIKTPRTFTVPVTEAELAGAIAHAFATSEGFEGEDTPADCGNDPIKFLKENNFYGAHGLTPEVTADLETVNFDEENFEWENGEGYCGCEAIVGFHTLRNGLTYLGITAGGDWETPLFYIIYWDGQKLRAYIPTDGNFWNTDTNTAYGSEGEAIVDLDESEKASDANIKKRFGVRDMQSLGDMKVSIIRDDIMKNIVSAKGDFVMPKGMADIDASKIAEVKAENDKREAQPYVRPPETMSSVKVIIQGNNLSPDVMPSGNFAERFADVRKDSEAFLKELDELSKMNLDAQAVQKALQIRDGVLRRVVSKYVTTVSLMQQMGTSGFP